MGDTGQRPAVSDGEDLSGLAALACADSFFPGLATLALLGDLLAVCLGGQWHLLASVCSLVIRCSNALDYISSLFIFQLPNRWSGTIVILGRR